MTPVPEVFLQDGGDFTAFLRAELSWKIIIILTPYSAWVKFDISLCCQLYKTILVFVQPPDIDRVRSVDICQFYLGER